MFSVSLSAALLLFAYLFLLKECIVVFAVIRRKDLDSSSSFPSPLPTLGFFFGRSPFWHVLGRVALRRHRVEHESQLASLLPGRYPVQADVELGAVGWVGVLGMGIGDAEGVDFCHHGALEAVVQALAL